MLTIKQLLDIPTMDPDEQRRARLLNILVVCIGLLVLFSLLATIIAQITNLYAQERVAALYGASLITLFGLVIIFQLNRRGMGWVASWLFLLLLTGILSATDAPQEIASGRSLLLFAVPILMASVLLQPSASFVMAGVSSLVITLIALRVDIPPNPFAMLTFFAIALASWLSARSLEQALAELRTINQELDQRVERRTQDLAEELSKNQAILESIADGVIVFDQKGQAIVTNPAMGRLLEQSPNQIVGHDIHTLMSQDVEPADQDMILSLLQNENGHSTSTRFRWGEKTVLVSLAPVLDAGDEATGTVAVFRDFTREAEVDRMKSSFISIASHELRTPLNAILGYAEMLDEEVYGPISSQQRGPVGRIMANTAQLLSLANNLLDQAQIEAGKLSLHIGTFSPADLVEDVRGMMEVFAETKNLELTVHIDDDVPATLSGDQQRLHQILINLVGNAVKFTKQGNVCIKVFKPADEHWALSVSDTGPGIPPEAHDYIFETFRQAGEMSTREHKGAGLGLSIVQQLVTLMDGDISLESQMGQGSTFTITLPIVPSPAVTAPEQHTT